MPLGPLIDDGTVKVPRNQTPTRQRAQKVDYDQLLGLTSSPTPPPTESDSSSTSGSYSGLLDQLQALARGETVEPVTLQGLLSYAKDNTPEKRAEAERLAERQVRMDAMGLGSPLEDVLPKMPEIGVEQRPKSKPRGEVVSMTAEEYNALDPQQRAAVDFNTMLVQAVRRDKRMNRKGFYDSSTEEQRDTYEADVQAMFGDGRGSDTYAPETLSVLKQIGYDDDRADFDDFLGLRAAITRKDLNYVGGSGAQSLAVSGSLSDVARDRITSTNDIAAATARMQEALVKGNALLNNIADTARRARAADLSILGGIYRQPETEAGFGQSEQDTDFQLVYQGLSDPKADISFEDVTAAWSGPTLENFLRYADERSRNAELYGLPLGEERDVKYRSPEEFRKLLGLDQIGG